MVPGVAGTELTVIDLAVLFPQAFPAVTEIVPLAKDAGRVTLIDLVPWPVLMVDPTGTVQL